MARKKRPAPTADQRGKKAVEKALDAIVKIAAKLHSDERFLRVFELFPGDDYCKPCSGITPSIADVCAVCGQERNLA